MRTVTGLKWVFGFVILCLTGSFGWAQENEVVMFLKQIAKRHPYFKQTALDSALAREVQKEMLGEQDYFFQARTNITHEKTASYDPFSPKSLTGSTISAGLTKKDWKTGGQFTLNWQYDWLHQQLTDLARQFMIPKNNYQQSLTATYSLPLLKNKMGILDRLQYELQYYEIEKAKLNLKESQENFLEEAAGQFLECAFLKEQIAITRREEELQQELFSYVQRRERAHLADSSDVVSSLAALLQLRQAREQLEGEYRAALQETAARYNFPELLAQPPQIDIYKIPQIPDGKSMEGIAAHSRPLQFIEKELERLDHLRSSLRNSELPELNLTLTAGVQKNHSKLGRSLLPNKPNIAIGLEFGLPIQNRSVQSRKIQTELEKKQAALSLQTLISGLLSDLQKLIWQYDNYKRAIELDNIRLQNSRRKNQLEKERYEKGLQSIDFVLMSRMDSMSLQHELLQKHYQLYLLWIRFLNLSDCLSDFGG